MESLSNNISYEKWIAENQEKVMQYVKQNDVLLKDVQMSSRAYNTLRMNGKNYMSDIVLCSSKEINALEKMCEADANEILMFKRNYLRNHKKALIAFVVKGDLTFKTELANKNAKNEKKNNSIITKSAKKEKVGFVKPEVKLQPKRSPYYVKLLLADESTKEKIVEFLTIKNIEILDFEISARTYNALRRGNVRFLHEALVYYPNRFDKFRNMGAKAIEEICAIIESYVFEQYDNVSLYIENGEILLSDSMKKSLEEETNPYKLTVLELIEHPQFKEKAQRYLKENNIPIQNMGLGLRAVNALISANILSFYDMLSIYPYELSSLKNIGVKSIDQIKEKMEYYISKMQNAVSAYCNGDMITIYSDEFVYDTIISCFENVGFEGISLIQVEEKFSKEIDKSRIKNCIDGLLQLEKLRCVDGNLYRVYPSVYLAVEASCLNDEAKEIILKKLSGMTFKAIGQGKGITRERARQKFENALTKLRDELRVKYRFNVFCEDYYEYLYSNYDITKELWFDFIGIDEQTFWYLSSVYSKGKQRTEDALDDSLIDMNIKSKIQGYLNRNKLFIDGVWLEKQRSAVENYALSKIARDELSFEEFAVLYNQLLDKNGIEFDKKLYYTQEVLNTRKNRLADSMYCLWKHGEKLRYYDIMGHNYYELLHTLNLGGYENIDVSTLKFFSAYPLLMAKYDIRDQYELHNLLKKILNVNEYNIVFQRQPMIRFGKSGRNQTIHRIR